MARYTLRYARIVILERTIQAGDIDLAESKAWVLEDNHANDIQVEGGKLLLPVGVTVAGIQDYEEIWETQEEVG
jgi:hypothetical protein